MKNKLILITLLLFAGCPVYAGNLNGFVGTSASYLKLNDPNFEYATNTDQLKINTLNAGLNYFESGYILSASTNRLMPSRTNREVLSKTNGRSFQNKTEIIADSLAFGYLLGKIAPTVFIANVQVDKGLYYNGGFIGRTKQSALLYGLNVNYFYDKNLSFSTTILVPNEELGLETGLIFGINYNFNLL